MRFLRRSLLGLFLTAMTLGLLVYAAALVQGAVTARLSEEPRMPQREERVFSVNVVAAEAETLRPILTAYGEVRSRRELEIRAGASGRIVELAEEMDEGGRVSQGQLLARIDPADAEAALDRAEADLQDAEAEETDAARAVELAQENLAAAEGQTALYERALARQRDLADRGVGSAAAVEEAELQLSTGRGAVIQRRQAVAEAEARLNATETAIRRARLAIAEAERALTDTEIRAGFTGTLSEVSVVEGRLVSESEQIARLIDPDALEVAFRVSTQGYIRLLGPDGELGHQDVTVRLDVHGTDIVASGRIERSAGSVAEGETGRIIFARLDRAPGFRPGDFVTVEVEEAPMENLARLPATALDAAGTVLVVGAEDRLEVVPVTLQRRQGDDILVDAGPVDGRLVVAQRTPLLGPGIKVRTLGVDLPDEEETADALMELSDERRQRLVAYVEGSAAMPDAAKERILAQLSGQRVPASVVERIESRIGG
ncbi:efflux RND transporter periplasmic adaptor subunit [Roseivivax sediminis]|uniref:RND family efflux transporter, MFP subunit n=1 Tax=Roseivivax sediminis TaxID=936889 RepID=A0A1I1W756_9RHOB|nr:HlyD family efflux transporter periplasmic adaptor subunit [Roseivivax sediminis]SFD91056.1 RND family efflux transporter, MFP subunit [Roseivivax sediminis]